MFTRNQMHNFYQTYKIEQLIPRLSQQFLQLLLPFTIKILNPNQIIINQLSFLQQMSISLSTPTLPRTITTRKELILTFQSLAIEDKYRTTRLISTQLIDFLLERIKSIDLFSTETQYKNIQPPKKGGKKENKMSEQSASDLLFDNLLVYSEGDFMDSIGLDYTLVKDATKMVDVLRVLGNKSTKFSPQKFPSAQSLNTKQDVSSFIAVYLLHQLQRVEELQKVETEHLWGRKQIGNYWAHLKEQEKMELLHLRYSSVEELREGLNEKGVVISEESLEKEIRQLAKLQKNQFCNRLLRCRVKKAVLDPIKMYHKCVYLMIASRFKSQRKKRHFKKEQRGNNPTTEMFQKQKIEYFQEKKQKIETQSVLQQNKQKSYAPLNFSPNISMKSSSQRHQQAKSHSQASNETNETEYRYDLKYFGQDALSKIISTLYHHKISSDLIDFGDMIANQANSFQKYRLVAFNRIQCCLSSLNVQLILFGSCANGLMIEKSDVDVALEYGILNYFPYGTIKQRVAFALSHLYQMLHQQPWITKCTLIPSASIPVLKLQIDTSVSVQCAEGVIDDTNTFAGYPEDKIKIEMDITVDTSPSGELTHLGLQATEMMKHWMVEIPNLRSIAILIKYMLQKTKLNAPYKGGLGSYCTIVMIIAYLKYYKKEHDDIVSQIEGFLNFYTKEFDQDSKLVDITKQPCFSMKQIPQGKLEVRDPLNGCTMTKNPYLYPKIKEQFLRLKGECFDNVKSRVEEHLEGVEEREIVMSMSAKEYFKNFQGLYLKNAFCEYEFM